MERDPAKHPAVYACIVLFSTIAGGVVGRYNTDYGSEGLFAVSGIELGCCFGVFLALLWSLLTSPADL